MAQKWTIRPAKEPDLAFIYATWLNSYRSDSPIAMGCRKNIYFNEYPKVIDWILGKDSTKVIVATLPDETNVILGYMVFQPSTLHYIFVKDLFRNCGIAKDLFNKSGASGIFTHKTKILDRIMSSHPDLDLKLIFNPFLLFHREGESYG